eukprot:GHVU01221422.1.p2 GENE.GHVU01221422.1~~GHVU01221422.1.p2  ORF type:complete len:135 (+),score=36.19 GHVU01221422.1:1-405(+)
MVMSDSFDMNVFKDSFRRLFDADASGHVRHGYNARMEVLCSKDFKVCGAIGACTSANKRGPQVSDSVVGEGATKEWIINGIDDNSTLALYFEVANQNERAPRPSGSGKQHAFLQLQTLYQHPSGRRRLRVTTGA